MQGWGGKTRMEEEMDLKEKQISYVYPREVTTEKRPTAASMSTEDDSSQGTATGKR